MKRQEWRGFVVGIFASLGLIVSAGAGVARAAAEPEPSFVIPTEEGVTAHATAAPQVEASFDLPAQAGEAFATTVGPGPEPTFELPTEAREAHATVAHQSEPDFGLQRAQVQEKH